MEATRTEIEAAYGGTGSRDWAKLLDIVERGGWRIFIYTNSDGDVCSAVLRSCLMLGLEDRAKFMEWMGVNGIFWIPTKEDNL